MKKYFLFILISLLAKLPLEAQLSNGSTCPNFTATDLSGNEWNLYELLDADKKVILNLFTAWDASSWSYYQSDELQSLDSTYGSLGTGEVQILFIEIESSNSTEQLFGPANYSNNHSIATQGDWVSDNPFPIVDSSALGDLLGISYFPTVYYICPDRLIYTIGQFSAAAIESTIFQSHCEPAVYDTDPMISYVSSYTSCETGETFLTIGLKNFGKENLTAATIEMTDGETIYPFPWNGNLETYESEELNIGPLDLGYKSHFDLSISSLDENPDNSQTTLEAGVPLSADTLILDLVLDNWPSEISWHILDAEGNVIHQNANNYIAYQWITDSLALPSDGCYTFEIFDTAGDGLNGTQWGGFDGRCSLKSYNWEGELVYTIFDYDGSYGFSELSTDFEVNKDVALDITQEASVSEVSAFTLYPNPARDLLNLQYALESPSNVSFEIRDLSGRLIKTENINGKSRGVQQHSLSLEALSPGVYFLTLSYEHKRSTMRFIKE